MKDNIRREYTERQTFHATASFDKQVDAQGGVKGDADLSENTGAISSTGAPTAAELESILGAPATAGRVRVAIGSSGGGDGEVYLCVDDGTDWHYTELIKSV